MARSNSKTIVLIEQVTGERKDFDSINAAARFLNVTFQNIQVAAYSGGSARGWNVYFGPETLRRHIAFLQKQLTMLEG